MDKVRVVVIDDGRDHSTQVAQALVEHGYDVIARFAVQDGLAIKLDKIEYDVMVMDIEEITERSIKRVGEISGMKALPFVIFAEHSDERLTEKAVNAGVTALVINGFHASRITSVIEVAMARYKYNCLLREEVEQARYYLMERKLIDRAKGIIMQHRHLTEDDAYKSMRKLAMDRNQKLVDVAKSIIEVSELLI